MPSLKYLLMDRVVLVEDSGEAATICGMYSLEGLSWSATGEPRAILHFLRLFNEVNKLQWNDAKLTTAVYLPKDEQEIAEFMDELGPIMPSKLAVRQLEIFTMGSGAEFYFEVLRRTATVDTLTVLDIDSTQLPFWLAPPSILPKFLHDVGGRLKKLHVTFDVSNEGDLSNLPPDYSLCAEDLRADCSTLTGLHTIDLRLMIELGTADQEEDEIWSDMGEAWSLVLAFLGAIPGTNVERLELGIFNATDTWGGEGEDPDSLPLRTNEDVDLGAVRAILERFRQLRDFVFYRSDSRTLDDA